MTIGLAEHSHAIVAARIYVCIICTYFKLVRYTAFFLQAFLLYFVMFIGCEINDCTKFNNKQKKKLTCR